MEVEGNRTTRNTSKPAQTADGTDMGQTYRQTDRQAYMRTGGALQEQVMFLQSHFRFLSARGMFLSETVPWNFRHSGTWLGEHKRGWRNTKMFF